MKYDDASWHYGGEFPAELPNHAGATHIGMFFAWCLLNGLGSKFHKTTDKLRSRDISPGQFFIAECDEKLTDEDLNQEGNAFASAYYDDDDSSAFFSDYQASHNPEGELPTDYHVADSWDNYDKLAPFVTRSYEKWKSQAPVVAGPAELFYSVCESVAENLKTWGYKYARSGPHISRRKAGFVFRIRFFERQRFRSIRLTLDVRSSKLKEWRVANNVLNPTDNALLGDYGSFFRDARNSEWTLKKPSEVSDMIW